MYGKDNRVLYSAKFSQGFEVVSAEPNWEGARFSTSRTKIGVTWNETHRRSRIALAESAVHLQQMTCVITVTGDLESTE